MGDRQTQKSLSNYVNTASDLAESVKRNIKNGGKIDKETVEKLNAFIIAANVINDMIEELNTRVRKYDN